MKVIELKTYVILRLTFGFVLTMTLLYAGSIVLESGYDASDDVVLTPEKRRGEDDVIVAERKFTHQSLSSLSIKKQPSTTLKEGSSMSVVILTYQRSGSSLVGDMFSRNADAFYLFEPLDALYVAMYGINHGWSVPSDITHYWNGTHRDLPDDEVQAVADYIDSVLSCNVDALPTEMLTHNYWTVHGHHMVNLDAYISCIRKDKLIFPQCQDENPWTCGRRFGQVDEKLRTECRAALWTRRYAAARSNQTGVSDGRPAADAANVENIVSKYSAYVQCLTRLRARVDVQCTALLRSACERSRLRVLKATRSSMRSVGKLIEQRHRRGDRNIRVIHSYRDPRAVALSRHRQGDPLLGKHAAFVVDSDPIESIVREARMYCRTVADDFRYRVDVLDIRYPGVVVSLDFDRSADDVVKTVDDAYRFVGVAETPKNIASWAGEQANRSRTLTNQWRSSKTLTKQLNDRILAMDECVELCRYIKCS